MAAVTAANISAATVEEIAPVTIFAPTNSAFAKIDNDTLTALLADPEALTQTLFRHIVPGKSVSLPDGIKKILLRNLAFLGIINTITLFVFHSNRLLFCHEKAPTKNRKSLNK